MKSFNHSRSHVLTSCLLILSSLAAKATTIEKIDFNEATKVGGVELKLNGVGLRKVEKFGIPFKVYVAGLYLKTAQSDSNEILRSEDPKFLRMVFLRRVNASDLVEAFEKGHLKNCLEKCEVSRKTLKSLTDKVSDVLDRGSMEFTFFKDHVEYILKGRKVEKGSIVGAEFSKNFLAIYLGKAPPTDDLKNGLVGLKQP